ncbi:hypothetical protein [Micromonospora sp. NPDC085948]|uniref:hypothetical protein n=1 Tax=Micromonospora sp. NPDC085948 TaxID=3155293 RepID=UPI003422021C
MIEIAFNILSNFIANVLFWVVLGGIFWLASKAGRRKFGGFFGLRTHSTISAYVSNLWLPESDQHDGRLLYLPS